MAKVAYLYLTHHDPELLARFAQFVSNGGGRIYAHVDARVDISAYKRVVSTVSNVEFVEPRIATYWGDFSYVEAVVETMRCALSGDSIVDRFVIVQGSDYPILSQRSINEFFDANVGVNFINAYDVMARGDSADIGKYLYNWNLKDSSLMARLSNKLKASLALSNLRVFSKKPGCVRLSDGKEMRIFSGWAHFSLTRKTAEYMVSFHDSRPEYNDYFRTVYASDESYFHTIFWNSHFSDSNIVPQAFKHWEHDLLLNNTYFEYPDVVREWRKAEEYAELLKTGKLFFRKVDSVMSKELLDTIDASAAR